MRSIFVLFLPLLSLSIVGQAPQDTERETLELPEYFERLEEIREDADLTSVQREAKLSEFTSSVQVIVRGKIYSVEESGSGYQLKLVLFDESWNQRVGWSRPVFDQLSQERALEIDLYEGLIYTLVPDEHGTLRQDDLLYADCQHVGKRSYSLPEYEEVQFSRWRGRFAWYREQNRTEDALEMIEEIEGKAFFFDFRITQIGEVTREGYLPVSIEESDDALPHPYFRIPSQILVSDPQASESLEEGPIEIAALMGVYDGGRHLPVEWKLGQPE